MSTPVRAGDSKTVGGDAGTRRIGICAPAKINLFLHIGEKRSDRFHALESLVVFAEVGDRMEFQLGSGLSLNVTGPFAAQVPLGEDNLVLRAARALSVEVKGAAIALEKNIPVAAGLGGGSADAAAALRALNVLWRLEHSEAELLNLAAELGSDVPACLLSRPCWMAGRGEWVRPVAPLPSIPAILVNPRVAVPTGPVFAGLNARAGLSAIAPPPGNLETIWDLIAYLDDSQNDLEAPACRLAPAIDEVLAALDTEPGCVLAQMSGSGATCFALFEGRHFALGAAERIAHEHPHWWVQATCIAVPDIGVPYWMA